MKAIVQDVYGTADVLQLRDVDRPVAGDDEVIVQVRAAGVDAGVWHLMTGLPLLLRLALGLRAPSNPVRGREVAGVVESVGAGVTRFAPGDQVFGIGEGTYAEYARARAAKLVPLPENLTFEQAAALPISGLTALHALRAAPSGQRVLVIGAGGGVGTFITQLAVARGAEVTGVCSTSKADLVRSLGAVDVIDYTRHGITGTYDVVFDIAGNRTLRVLRKFLTPRGTLVIVGGEKGGRLLGGTERLLRAALWSPFIGQRLVGLFSAERQPDLEELSSLAAAGKITPVVDRTFPLGEAPEAIRYAQEGRARGKVVVTV
ncbi:NAD(P)-dependent alcohol dehydrogenase [Lentzea tibetensis]|uniref:NAD(P)-dependent alcohol dehydrogenase n=1 Tax=Lentzea tibetensis TaxID=2591470 RepID=A0A563ERR5_9PSEU|nr:NAD(P)-dependent alcohol dehydrogenase [Lentzea tibetensis]TWP49551.1 NAD(P)-dependent alcohol dehydrogenase [Lentzea tibetensis]